MIHSRSRACLELLTADSSLLLRESSPADAAEYYALIARNRGHLTQFGNYHDEGRATFAWVERSLSRPRDGLRFGVRSAGELVGRVELARRAGRQFTLAYWLGRDHLGRGFMFQSLSRLMQHARERFLATAFFASVTHGNHKSAAVLLGLGYAIAVNHVDYAEFVSSVP